MNKYGLETFLAHLCLRKKYRKVEYYIQRVMRFVIKWLHLRDFSPCPHYLINKKLCTSNLCIKMLSFLYMCACAMPRISYSSYHYFPWYLPKSLMICMVSWKTRLPFFAALDNRQKEDKLTSSKKSSFSF